MQYIHVGVLTSHAVTTYRRRATAIANRFTSSINDIGRESTCVFNYARNICSALKNKEGGKNDQKHNHF